MSRNKKNVEPLKSSDLPTFHKLFDEHGNAWVPANEAINYLQKELPEDKITASRLNYLALNHSGIEAANVGSGWFYKHTSLEAYVPTRKEAIANKGTISEDTQDKMLNANIKRHETSAKQYAKLGLHDEAKQERAMAEKLRAKLSTASKEVVPA